MLQSLDIRNLTVFVEANLRFSPQLNVIIGENGSGKSHLLKVAYAMLAASAEEGRKPTASSPTKATGSLLDQGYLFLDAPETNLNPKLIKEAALTILHLCHSGVQVFIATHSLFLMREFDMQLQQPTCSRMRARFFGLQFGYNGIDIQQGDSVNDIGAIAALDEELSQSDRYRETEA